MVPEAGLEPARHYWQGILSPQCLPFHHPGVRKIRIHTIRALAVLQSSLGVKPIFLISYLTKVQKRLILTITNSIKSLLCDIALVLKIDSQNWLLQIIVRAMRRFYRIPNIFTANIINTTNLGTHSQMQVFTTTIIWIGVVK